MRDAAITPKAGGAAAPEWRHAARDLLERYGLFVFCALLIAFGALVSANFLSAKNLQDVLTQAAPLGIVVVGQTFVLLVRGFDLSVASLMATVAVIATAFNATSNLMVPVIFLVGIAFCTGVGLINGWLVTKRNVSPFLATLAMMIVLQGFRFAYTGGAPSGALPDGFRVLGTGRLLGLPINLLALLLIAALFGALLHATPFGRKVYIVGGNPEAARLCGIAADRVPIACYVISSVLAGIAGLFLVGYVGSIDNWVGRGYELDSIVACVMGGVAITGGRGSIFGALAGALILIILFNLVLLLGFQVQWQYVLKGVIIIVAAAFYLNRSR